MATAAVYAPADPLPSAPYAPMALPPGVPYATVALPGAPYAPMTLPGTPHATVAHPPGAPVALPPGVFSQPGIPTIMNPFGVPMAPGVAYSLEGRATVTTIQWPFPTPEARFITSGQALEVRKSIVADLGVTVKKGAAIRDLVAFQKKMPIDIEHGSGTDLFEVLGSLRDCLTRSGESVDFQRKVLKAMYLTIMRLTYAYDKTWISAIDTEERCAIENDIKVAKRLNSHEDPDMRQTARMCEQALVLLKTGSQAGSRVRAALGFIGSVWNREFKDAWSSVRELAKTVRWIHNWFPDVVHIERNFIRAARVDIGFLLAEKAALDSRHSRLEENYACAYIDALLELALDSEHAVVAATMIETVRNKRESKAVRYSVARAYRTMLGSSNDEVAAIGGRGLEILNTTRRLESGVRRILDLSTSVFVDECEAGDAVNGSLLERLQSVCSGERLETDDLTRLAAQRMAASAELFAQMQQQTGTVSFEEARLKRDAAAYKVSAAQMQVAFATRESEMREVRAQTEAKLRQKILAEQKELLLVQVGVERVRLEREGEDPVAKAIARLEHATKLLLKKVTIAERNLASGSFMSVIDDKTLVPTIDRLRDSVEEMEDERGDAVREQAEAVCVRGYNVLFHAHLKDGDIATDLIDTFETWELDEVQRAQKQEVFNRGMAAFDNADNNLKSLMSMGVDVTALSEEFEQKNTKFGIAC